MSSTRNATGALAAIMLAGAVTLGANDAHAIPSDATLLGSIGQSTADWTNTGAAADQSWSALDINTATFTLQQAANFNTFGVANNGGNSRTALLSTGDSVGTTKSFTPPSDPFTFYLESDDGTSDFWFSRVALNSDGDDHLITFAKNTNSGVSQEFLLFWEDLPNLGDQDFRDFVVRVKMVAKVPTPGTLALFGFGLAAFGLVRRRRSA